MTETIYNVLHLPARKSTYGDMSMRTLLEQTGYIDNYKNFGVKEILEGLNENATLADSWLTYSSEKRSNAGWYIQDNENGKYLVGYYPEDVDLPLRKYTEVNRACAVFIKQEIEDIRQGS